MKLVWCPEIVSKAYIDGVGVLADHDCQNLRPDGGRAPELNNNLAGQTTDG
jgi:hypothetical protein